MVTMGVLTRIGLLAIVCAACKVPNATTSLDVDAGVEATCGDGTLNPGEICDDGNKVSGDGCADDCLSDEDCGNGLVDVSAMENCDDGNTIGGDGCSADCFS